MPVLAGQRIFTVAGTSYAWEDLVLAGCLWGDWPALEARARWPGLPGPARRAGRGRARRGGRRDRRHRVPIRAGSRGGLRPGPSSSSVTQGA